ncbi:hypothetical protein [Mucilaginibacter sp. 10I4]|uniref:hypothetical protein n=1 Tax=Mucilaginibacter sp. 10I4 TaxID=3048580 RepID=UPI002B239362|nr:hypothetical protein [Mucilaginibacter sp. 10I4]MEB0260712.1 hypothetical protein [Mucilaginibacter sp. 10I4]
MKAEKIKYHQNRPGLAFGLMVLFVVLTALCPIKRIFFNFPGSNPIQQRAKITSEKRNVTDTRFEAAIGGTCGLSYITFKRSFTDHTPVSTDFTVLCSLVFTFLFFFKLFSQPLAMLNAVSHRTSAVPLFLRNQLLLI